VPYNPFLSKKYNAHINVEVCSSISAVKYLYKYVYKGHDRALAELVAKKPDDEIKQFLDSRYVSTSEAFWRIFGFKMHDEYPKVCKLQLHLPDAEQITFKETENPVDILNKNYESTLTGTLSH
jgi:hypothetical protein